MTGFFRGMAVTALVLAPATAGGRSPADLPETFGREPNPVYAHRFPYVFRHDAGLLTMRVTNLGMIGSPYAEGERNAGWNGGEYLNFAGLWIGAIGEDGKPRVSTGFPLEMRPSLDPVDTIYESYEDVPGGTRFGLAADDDGDGRVNEEIHNGRDDDGDGKVDEDFAVLGHQMLSCTFRDDTPEALDEVRGHVPLGLEVLQRSMQWSSPDINEFVGLDYRIVNTGMQHLRDLYVGFRIDFDAGLPATSGYWSDDLVGYARIDIAAGSPGSVDSLSIDLAYVWDAPDSGTTRPGGHVPGFFGFMFLGHETDPEGIRAPARVGLTTVRWIESGSLHGDLGSDYERYDLMSSRFIPWRNAVGPGDYIVHAFAGPFAEMNPGDTLDFQAAFVIGDGFDGMVRNAVTAQRLFHGAGPERRWVAGQAPPAPQTNLTRVIDPEVGAFVTPPGGDRKVTIQWNNLPEVTPDPFFGRSLFEGYRVWRAESWTRPSGSAGPAPEDWTVLAEFRCSPPDRIVPGFRCFREIRRPGRPPIRFTPYGPLYPIGRYEWIDDQGLVNGKAYYYAVTSLNLVPVRNQATGEPDSILVSGLPSARPEQMVVPSWEQGTSCKDVGVVPNPWRGGAEWDFAPGGCDPSGSRVAFRNLPAGWTRLGIFSLAGDRVFTGHPGESRYLGGCEVEQDPGRGGTFYWDLLNDERRAVASGVYLYVVESPVGDCRGRFAVIR